MEFLTSFSLLITLIAINFGVSEAFTCEEGWLQGPGDLQQYWWFSVRICKYKLGYKSHDLFKCSH